MRSPSNHDVEPRLSQRIGEFEILPVRYQDNVRMEGDDVLHAGALYRFLNLLRNLNHIGVDRILHARVDGGHALRRSNGKNDLIERRRQRNDTLRRRVEVHGTPRNIRNRVPLRRYRLPRLCSAAGGKQLHSTDEEHD